MQRTLKYTLFPYTTLFRSDEPPLDDPLFERIRELNHGVTAHIQRGAALERSEEHTSELQSLRHLVCRLLLEKKNKILGRITRPEHILPSNYPRRQIGNNYR